MQDAHLGEHVFVPLRLGADTPGEPANTVGEGSGAGVGEPAGQLVPRCEAADARVGEAGAETILEPAVELDESTDEPLTRSLRDVSLESATGSGAGSGRPSSSSSGASPDVAGREPVASRRADDRRC